jgi:hypothetical protein
VTVRRNRRPEPEPDPGPSVVEILQARLGWKQPKIEPFYTTANCQCGGCRKVLPASAFDMPFGPGRNKCRVCSLLT